MDLTLDSEGYPTEESLAKITAFEAVDVESAADLVNAVRTIWWMPDWGFTWDGYRKLELHTGGWSGNESIIHALRENFYFWRFWKAHFSGGHYHFEIK